MKCKSILLVIGLLFGSVQATYAQRFTFPTANEGSKHTADQMFRHASPWAGAPLPDTITAWSYMWFTQKTVSPASAWPKVLSANAQVKMYVNHAHNYKVNTSYVYRMAYTMVGYRNYSDSLNGISVSIPDTLTIGYNPDSLTAYQDIAVRSFPGFIKAMVVVNGIYRILPNGSIAPYNNYLYNSGAPIDTNFTVEVSIGVQRYTRAKSTPATMGLSASASGSGDFLQVNWTSGAVVEPANYELEWTYIDNYAGGNNTEYDFRHNSSRVVTTALSYKIPLVYQQGTLLYRVRMVRPDSTTLRTPIYGPWTLPDQGTISSAAGKYNIAASHMGDAANWQYKISFAEEGKYKHVMSYFDGLLYNRQSITRFNSLPNKLLVTQNIYDYEGRPAITTLPAPISSGTFIYQPNVALHAFNGQPYRAAFFDTVQRAACPAEQGIAGFTNTSVSSRYYSAANTDTMGYQKFVPDAGGYPFVQTIYAPGYDKRVERQGGAGDSLQIGLNHDTRYEYVTTDQIDLNRLFGLNAGKASFYHKTVSKDPNGQFSVSVKDYEGKQIMSALLGEVPDTLSGLALQQNAELPADTMYYNDLMDGVSQKVTGLSRILDNGFFMDAAANDVLKYNFRLVPYPVCTSPTLGLSVKASYHASVFDKCGTEVINKSGIVGTTGVIKSTSPVLDSVLETAYLDKGKYTVHKELYVNESDVDAAVDSFFHASPTCLKTEDWFIRQEVQATQFPCPAPDDECARLRKQMMDQLIPGGKYAQFTTDASGNIAWDVTGKNSIFDKKLKVVNGSAVQVYRYQQDCTGGRLDALQITVKGHTYTNLSALSVRDFLDVYQNAGSQQYAIAEALLPTHPEFCKLSTCFVDTFETRFTAIPDAAAAATTGLLNLNDILAADPLVNRLNSALSTVSSSYADSLRMIKYIGGIDTQALRMAYCDCNDSVVRTQCLGAYSNAVGQLTLPTAVPARDLYFKRLKELYLFNRNKYKNYLPGLGGDCQPCMAERMQLTPDPLVPVMYNKDGTINLGSGSVMSLFSSNVRSQLLGRFGGGSAISNDPDTMAKYLDSATLVVYRADSALGSIQIDSIAARMANCGAFSAHEAAFRAALQSLIINGYVHFGQFSPAQVRGALVTAGIALDDLCNPYIPSYDYSNTLTSSPYGCLQQSYYTDAKNWLNGAVVLAALGTPSTNSITLSPGSNAFENQICTSLGVSSSQSVSLTTTYDAVNHLYTLALSNGGNSLNLFVRAGANSPSSGTGNIFTSTGGWSGSFSKVVCVREQSAFSSEGYVGAFVFGAEVLRSSTAATETYQCIGWNSEAFEVNSMQANVLGACVPCTEMKKLYAEFRDTMLAYNVSGSDHPLYSMMLRSFMNYRLAHVFTAGDYADFIQSCALADSATIGQYLAYGYVTVPSASTFATTLSAKGITLQTLLRYKSGGSSNETLLIDFGGVPFDKVRSMDSLLNTGGGYNNPAFVAGNVAGWLVLPTDTATIPSSLSSLFSFGSPQIDSVWIGSRYQAYSRYTATFSGLQPWQLSRNIETVRQYLYQNGIHGSWLTRYQSTVNADYYKTQKQDLLRYTYSLQAYPMAQVLDSLNAAHLQARVPGLASAAVTYQLPGKASALNNLYYSAPGSFNTNNYIILQHILSAIYSNFGGHPMPTLTGDSIVIGPLVGSNDDLRVYYCSDKAYWYRYFDGVDHLYNIYVKAPDYLSSGTYPSLSLASGIMLMAGDTMARNFELAVSPGNGIALPYRLQCHTDFDISSSGALRDVLLTTDVNPAPPLPGLGQSCEEARLNTAIYTGKVNYEEFMRKFRLDLKTNFMAYLQDSISEGLSMGYNDRRFNITLYRYDRAGNLIETVPPAGVRKLALTTAQGLNTPRTNNTYQTAVSAGQVPQHQKSSRYFFNTIDKPVSEVTPDGGDVQYTYDPAGRVLFSQNDRQKPGINSLT